MPVVIDDPPASLAADQRLVFEQLCKLVVQQAHADASYNRLPASKNGTVISVDVARFLAPEFRSWDGRIRHTPSTAIPAGAYAHDRLLRELARSTPSQQRRVLHITAGGAGSGKTTLLSKVSLNASLVFDNQLRNYKRADVVLSRAIASGWKVHVSYVHRPFADVVKGVVERSQRTGRWNALDELAQSHIDAQTTIVRLRRKYASAAQFRAIYNASELSDRERPRGARVFFFELAEGGCYHLPSAETLRAQVVKVVQASVKQGRISKEFARILLRSGTQT